MPWRAVASVTDFAERNVIGVAHETLQIALYRLGDCIYATSDTCPHQYAQLSEGEVVGGFVECPAHYALFDIKTGRCEGGVTDRSISTYPVKVEDGRVFVML
jgi:nitrite reductase/ring-hydroxylating ferredoxin subunit